MTDTAPAAPPAAAPAAPPAAPATPAAAPAPEAPALTATPEQLAAIRAGLHQTPAPAPAAPATPAPAAPATPAPPAAPAPAAPAPVGTVDGVDTTGWPQEAIDAYTRRDGDAKRYQREAGDRRIGNKDQVAAVRALAEAVGVPLPPDPTATPDPSQVIAQVQAERFELALSMAALEHRVPADKLDFLSFKVGRNAEAQALDATAPDYRAKLSAIALSEIQSDASLLGSGTQQQVAMVQNHGGAVGNANLDAASFGSMSPLERAQLYTTDRPAYDRLVAEESAITRR